MYHMCIFSRLVRVLKIDFDTRLHGEAGTFGRLLTHSNQPAKCPSCPDTSNIRQSATDVNWNIAQILRKAFKGFHFTSRYTSFKGLAVTESSTDSEEHIKARKLVLVGTADKPKWLHFQCPCKCGDTISLN